MKQLIHSSKSLGLAIKRQRKTKNLSQKNAGKTLSIEQSTFSSIERGAPGTRLETLFRVLAALDLEIVIQSKEENLPQTKQEW